MTKRGRKPIAYLHEGLPSKILFVGFLATEKEPITPYAIAKQIGAPVNKVYYYLRRKDFSKWFRRAPSSGIGKPIYVKGEALLEELKKLVKLSKEERKTLLEAFNSVWFRHMVKYFCRNLDFSKNVDFSREVIDIFITSGSSASVLKEYLLKGGTRRIQKKEIQEHLPEIRRTFLPGSDNIVSDEDYLNYINFFFNCPKELLSKLLPLSLRAQLISSTVEGILKAEKELRRFIKNIEKKGKKQDMNHSSNARGRI